MQASYNKCPHCDSNEGFYITIHFYGKHTFTYNFDGSEHESFRPDTFEDATEIEDKHTYCIGCNKKLFSIKEEKGV